MPTISLSELKSGAEARIKEQDDYYTSIGYRRVGNEYVKDPNFRTAEEQYDEDFARSRKQFDFQRDLEDYNRNRQGQEDKANSLNDLAGLIVNNPSLYADLTSEQKAGLLPLLAKRGFKNFAKLTKPKERTAEQLKTEGFARRVENSSANLERIMPQLKQLTTAGFFLKGKLPNFAKGAVFQQLEQAQRDFINANLRRESGAAISPSEFADARRQYFPQPGDTSEVLEQKRRNRITVMENLNRESGRSQAISANSREGINALRARGQLSKTGRQSTAAPSPQVQQLRSKYGY